MFRQYPDFASHELVTCRQDGVSGLTAFIAVHNSHLGPAIGGCRILRYPSADEAIKDVLRLSQGMTYKSAIARIPYGGGKAVIVADPTTQKTRALLHAMGDFVENLGGRYITSFDSGTTLEDVRTIGEHTQYTAGALAGAGNASTSTAYGVFQCLKAAIRARLDRDSLEGVRVTIQGVGNVGGRLARLLSNHGARLTIADPNSALADEVAEQTGARVANCDDIHRIEADVFSPCALGGILSARTIPELGAQVVVGGANNQLATRADDRRLLETGVLYCPDYLANAGGIIDLHYQRSGWSRSAVERHVEGLAVTFQEIIERSRAQKIGTGQVADSLVEARFHPTGAC